MHLPIPDCQQLGQEWQSRSWSPNPGHVQTNASSPTPSAPSFDIRLQYCQQVAGSWCVSAIRYLWLWKVTLDVASVHPFSRSLIITLPILYSGPGKARHGQLSFLGPTIGALRLSKQYGVSNPRRCHGQVCRFPTTRRFLTDLDCCSGTGFSKLGTNRPRSQIGP